MLDMPGLLLRHALAARLHSLTARRVIFYSDAGHTWGEFLDEVHVLAVLEGAVQPHDVLVVQPRVDLDLPRHLHVKCLAFQSSEARANLSGAGAGF